LVVALATLHLHRHHKEITVVLVLEILLIMVLVVEVVRLPWVLMAQPMLAVTEETELLIASQVHL
jgi:hypothetical protein